MTEKNNMNKLLPGIFIVALITLPTWLLDTLVPFGGPVCGILLGMLMAFWYHSQYNIVYNCGK